MRSTNTKMRRSGAAAAATALFPIVVLYLGGYYLIRFLTRVFWSRRTEMMLTEIKKREERLSALRKERIEATDLSLKKGRADKGWLDRLIVRIDREMMKIRRWARFRGIEIDCGSFCWLSGDERERFAERFKAN